MLSKMLNLLPNVLCYITDLRCLPPTEIQISDLLPFLERKRDPSGLQSLSLLVLPCSPSVPKAADAPPPPAKGRGAPLVPLPDSFQRLAERRSKQHYHQSSSSRGSRGGQTSVLEQRTGASGAKAPAECFFLPYIVVGRLGLQRSESPSSIRELFQQGVLSSQILGLRACTSCNPSLWVAVKEPHANSGTSEQYFEDLGDLERRLFQRPDSALRPPQEDCIQRRALRNICLCDSSMCCSPPLVCRHQIYYTSFSK